MVYVQESTKGSKMSGTNGVALKHGDDEKSTEFQELLSEVDKLKDSLKNERYKNADADRKRLLILYVNFI